MRPRRCKAEKRYPKRKGCGELLISSLDAIGFDRGRCLSCEGRGADRPWRHVDDRSRPMRKDERPTPAPTTPKRYGVALADFAQLVVPARVPMLAVEASLPPATELTSEDAKDRGLLGIERPCCDCGNDFFPNSGNQKRCAPCRPAAAARANLAHVMKKRPATKRRGPHNLEMARLAGGAA